jgi:hypothetical protein
MELYVMRKELGIYKYCMIEKAPIPLSRVSTVDGVYPVIHTLMTLRYAVASTINKILNSSSGYEEYEYSSGGEMTRTVATPESYKFFYLFIYLFFYI